MVIGVALVGGLLAWPAAAQNAVNDWSLKAQIVITAGRSPGSVSRTMARWLKSRCSYARMASP
jgi:hypothetical protein